MFFYECSIDCLLPIRDISVVSIVLFISLCSLMYLNIVPLCRLQMQFGFFQQCEIVYNLNCYRIGLGHIFVLDSLVLVYLPELAVVSFPLNKDMKSVALLQ
jgi:hypothetical protein